ncbi:MAG TPA: FtsX-like permease family protein [Pseudomonadota bacterium]|jgi:putative ABC transport system permease protein|nr:FtsX-like permease family protein [Pseudomonadota bacterium]HNN54368.1 FtsX-like permease family protein [Pseudomonadota bacterium]
MLLSLFRIASRSVLRHRRRSIITFLAVFLAVAVMLCIKGFLSGMQASIVETTVHGQTGALQVHRKGIRLSEGGAASSLHVPTDDAFLQRLLSVPGVKAVAGRILFSGMLSTRNLSSVALLVAIDPKKEKEVCPLSSEMVSKGKSLMDADPDAAVLTAELAKRLGLQFGHQAAVLGNDRDGVLSAIDVRFVGVYGQPGFARADKQFGIVSLSAAQQLLHMESQATEIVISVDNLDEVEAIKPRLQAAAGPEYEVKSFRDVASFLDDVVERQNFVLNLCSGIFLCLALIGIGNTMLMSVNERTREIGTMMSLGVRRRQILCLFLIEAMLLGLSGGLCGTVVGNSLVSYLGYKGILLRIPGMTAPVHIYPRLSLGYTAFMILVSACGAVLAALWPAIRASALRPVQALTAV